MAYFDQIGKINYQGQDIDNLFFAYRIPERFYEAGIFQEILVRSGERPERLSERIYGTDQLWWLVLIYNNIVNVFEDWPADNDEIELFAELESRRRFGDDYTMAQYSNVFDELSLINDAKRQVRLPLRASAIEIIDDIDGFFRRQRQQ